MAGRKGSNTPTAHYLRRALAMCVWCLLVWEVLVWTLTWEQQLFGLAISALAGLAFAPFGEVAAPWRLLSLPRLARILGLAAQCLIGIVTANLSLARRIWSPRRPLRSGMVIVATTMQTDGGLAATGLLSSLIVDNQIVDLDRSSSRLQYHAVDVPSGDAEEKGRHVNRPIERWLRPLTEREAAE